MLFTNLLCITAFLLNGSNASEDYYELFGIARDATNRDIRKAFKKLAVLMHPDKNPDDSEADAKFIKITRAYEVLKDTESRKRYDLYGDDEPKSGTNRQSYQSWSYYHDQFGIYDDDPEIITLNQADFENSVMRSRSLWFVNFYSSHCSHCHHLAPTWRRLARTLKGVVRIGAVNCDEDWNLCRQQNVRSYPSLIMYPAREKYHGDRSEDALTDFVLASLHIMVGRPTLADWDRRKAWVVYLCETSCIEDNARVIVAALLAGLVSVGEVNCDDEPAFCDELMPGSTGGGIVYYQPGGSDVKLLESGESGDIADQVLALLPEPVALDRDTYEDMVTRLQMGATGAWLVHFDIGGGDSREDLEWRKLPALVPAINLARLHCARYVDICTGLHVRKYPTFIVLKPGGGHETHHGRTTVHDVADFAMDSAAASNTVAISEEDLLHEGVWLVDFFAPWCPPCLRLLPELRAASRDRLLEDAGVRVATVDCTAHDALCLRHRVNSYPTTVLLNNSAIVARYRGASKADDIVEFVQDVLQPVVLQLNEDNFYTSVGVKTTEELWLVDFMAPWCGPCQQLAPEWRRLAKMLTSLSYVKLGEVNCEEQSELCSQQGVRSYPTIRLYPLGGEGLRTTAMYSGHQRDAMAIRRWLVNFLPSAVTELDPDSVEDSVVRGTATWLVVFQAPWCGHCVAFEPEFILLAERLGDRVKCGKLDCDRYRTACQAQGVRGYPTVKFYSGAGQERRGREITSQSGDEIVRVVELWLKEGSARVHDEF